MNQDNDMAHPIYFEVDAETVREHARSAISALERQRVEMYQRYDASARKHYNRRGIGGWFTRLVERDEDVYAFGHLLCNTAFRDYKAGALRRHNELFQLICLPRGVERVMISTEDASLIGLNLS